MTTRYNEKQLEVIALRARKAELLRTLETVKKEIGVTHSKLAAAECACSASELRQILTEVTHG